MDSIITIIIFVIGAVIGGLTVHLLKRNSNNIEESESLNDVKDLRSFNVSINTAV